MDKQRLLDAIAETIREEILPHLAAEGTIESYTKHYFVKWYNTQIAKGNNITLESFLEKIPDELKITKRDNAGNATKKYAKLLNAIMDADPLVAMDENSETDPGPDDL